VIVDNGSEDESVGLITTWIEKSDFSYVQFVKNPRNMGFSAGMNRGIDAFELVEPDFYWLLNNDLVTEPGALGALLDSAAQQPNVKIWGPTVIDSLSGKVQCAGGCRYWRWLGIEIPVFAGKSLSDSLASETPAYDYIYGAAMFIQGKFIKDCRGLDESYFLFYEELELSHRLSSSWDMAWCKKAVVRHDGSKMQNTPKAIRAFTAYHAALSAYRYTWKHYPYCIATVVLCRVLGLGYLGVRGANAGLSLAALRALGHFLKPGR